MMDKPSAHLEPLHHRSERHIKVVIPNDEGAKSRIRQVQGRKWSSTHGCWYVPYTTEAYRQLKELFEVTVPEVFLKKVKSAETALETIGTKPEIVSPTGKNAIVQLSENQPTTEVNSPDIRIEKENDWRLKIFIPREQKDWIEKVKTIPGRAWNQKGKYWSVPMVKTAIASLQSWFGKQLKLTIELPPDLPETYLPKNWRKQQPANDATPAPVPDRHDLSSGLKKMLPDWMQKPVAAPSLPPPVAVSQKTGVNAGPTDKDTVRAFRSRTDNNLAQLQVPAHRQDWIGFVKTLTGARWMPGEKVWSLPGTRENYDRCRAFWGESLVVVERETSLFAPAPDETVKQHKNSLPPPIQGRSGTITLSPHPRHHDYLLLYLPKGMKETCLETVKNIHGRKWNYDYMAWEVPYTRLTLRFLQKYLSNVLHFTFSPKADLPEQLPVAQRPPAIVKEPRKARYEEAVLALEACLLLKRYSYRTIKSYKNCFRNFILYYNDTKPSTIGRGQIDAYLLHMIKERKISESHQNQIISSILLFYREVVKQAEKVERLFRPKMAEKLPNVFTEEEVIRLLKSITNPKHRCIIMVIYSAGLRLSEAVNLRLPDMQPDKNRIFVRGGKGKKDRCTILSEKLKNILREYLEVYKPASWLFEGATGGQYSVRSVQAIFEKAKKVSKVNEYATVHTLRHSFATHMLEKGVDRTYIQDFLGHADPRTTEIYLHITQKGIDKLKSPLDDLDI